MTLFVLFLLTISLVGLAASIYALGYVTEFYGRVSIALLGSLFNGFLLAMTLVVLADNGFFFLIAWELMSLVSYFLVVTEHEKAEVRYAGFFYLIMTHVGTAFIILAFLIFFQGAGSFSFEAFRHPEQPLPEGMRTLGFLAGPDRLWDQSRHCAAARLVALRAPGGAVAYLSAHVRRDDQDGDLRARYGCTSISSEGSSLGGGDLSCWSSARSQRCWA